MAKLNLKSENGVVETPKINGFLCALSTKAWSASKKIPIETLKKISNAKLSEWVRSNKGLIDNKALEGIHSHITKARNIMNAYSLPFPVKSINLIPKDNIVKLSQELDDIIASLEIEVKSFASNYKEHIKNAEKELGPQLFNRSDYPRDIESRFGIEYKFLELGVPGEFKEISPELYSKEASKFQNMMEKARNECVIFLREAFVKELSIMVDALTGKTEDGKERRIREDTMSKIDKFFEMFKTKNIFNDTELLKEIEKARTIMVGIEASDLRNSDKLKNMIAEQITKVAETVDDGIYSYRRKLTL